MFEDCNKNVQKKKQISKPDKTTGKKWKFHCNISSTKHDTEKQVDQECLWDLKVQPSCVTI